jgi:multiple sugar transport system substrate-binding protein
LFNQLENNSHKLSKKKKLVAVSTASVLAMSTVFLGVGAGVSAQAVDPCVNKTLSLLSVGDPFQYALQEVLPQFTAETGIKVNLQSLDNQTLQTRLAAAFVTHKSDLDVVTVDNIYVGQYYDNGWISSLNNYIKNDKSVNLGDFIPQVLYSISEWRGQFVGLPIAPYAQGVMYRPDVYKKFGLKTPPTDPAKTKGWTWDQYLKNAQIINGKTFGGKKMYGTVIAGKEPVPIVHMYTQLMAGMGARWFKKFPEAPWNFTPTLDSPQNVAAATMYRNLYKVSPPEAIGYDWFAAGMRFAAGDIGQMYWWTPYFYLVENNGYMSGKPSSIVGKYKIAPLPTLPGKPANVSTGGWQLSIPSTADCPDKSWQLVKWVASSKVQKEMALVKKYGTQFADFGRLSNYKDPQLVKIYPWLPLQLKMMQQGNGKVSRPGMMIYPALEGVYGLQLNKILLGADVKKTLTETNSMFTNILAGNLLLPFKGVGYNDTFANTQKLIASLE